MLIQKQTTKINFTGDRAGNSVANTTMIFLLEEVKETVSGFSQGTMKLRICFTLI